MLNDNPPVSIIDGNVIKQGYNSELDELRNLSNNAKEWLVNFQNQEREKTGISSLKVNFNKVFGYYIEITNTHKEKVPDDYIRKQTLVNSERYITEELKNYETKILTAAEKIYQIELDLFNELRNLLILKCKSLSEKYKIDSCGYEGEGGDILVSKRYEYIGCLEDLLKRPVLNNKYIDRI